MNDISKYIEEVWYHEQDILNVVHDICIEHNLKYSLIFGTLLGAIRHKGFIPWDDDVDIIMPRKDYEKLLSIWNDVAPKGYILQNKRTDFDFSQNFTKIRKDNTAFIQFEFEKTVNYHTGIFIDIFPADKVAPKGIKRKLQYIACAFNLLFARGIQTDTKGIIRIIQTVLHALPLKAQMSIYNKTEKYISKWQDVSEYKYFSPNTIDECKRYFDSDLFNDITTVEFNHASYCCVCNYDKLLTQIYGNYMKLPPEKDRVWKHHPIIIDCEKNYADIAKEQGEVK